MLAQWVHRLSSHGGGWRLDLGLTHQTNIAIAATKCPVCQQQKTTPYMVLSFEIANHPLGCKLATLLGGAKIHFNSEKIIFQGLPFLPTEPQLAPPFASEGLEYLIFNRDAASHHVTQGTYFMAREVHQRRHGSGIALPR